MPLKETTTTTLVELELRAADDFVSRQFLIKRTGRSPCQVGAALIHLRKYRVIDVIINSDGTGWWYALPHEGDTRCKTCEERTPETKPRKQRKPKK